MGVGNGRKWFDEELGRARDLESSGLWQIELKLEVIGGWGSAREFPFSDC